MTLWTSADGNEGEAPKEEKTEDDAAVPAEEKPEEAKPAETEAES